MTDIPPALLSQLLSQGISFSPQDIRTPMAGNPSLGTQVPGFYNPLVQRPLTALPPPAVQSGLMGGFNAPTVGPSSPLSAAPKPVAPSPLGLNAGPAVVPPAVTPGVPGTPTFNPMGSSTAPVTGAVGGGIKGLISNVPKYSGKVKAGLGFGLPIAGAVLGSRVGGQESPLGRFLIGAGTGAGIGSLGGPWGTAIGGVVGGIGNALLGSGEKEVDYESRLNDILTMAPVPEDQRSEYRLIYEVMSQAGGGSDEAKAQALSAVGTQLLTDLQSNQDAQAAQSEMLATQALTAEFFRPMTQQLIQSAQQRAAIGEQMAADLPPAYRAVARSQNAASLDNATRTANAYAVQAQLLPSMANLEYQKGLADQISQQQASQVMAQMGIGGGGGGAGSLAELASQIPLNQ